MYAPLTIAALLAGGVHAYAAPAASLALQPSPSTTCSAVQISPAPAILPCKAEGRVNRPNLIRTLPASGKFETCQQACEKDDKCVSFAQDTKANMCSLYRQIVTTPLGMGFEPCQSGIYFWNRFCFKTVCSVPVSGSSCAPSTVTATATITPSSRPTSTVTVTATLPSGTVNQSTVTVRATLPPVTITATQPATTITQSAVTLTQSAVTVTQPASTVTVDHSAVTVTATQLAVTVTQPATTVTVTAAAPLSTTVSSSALPTPSLTCPTGQNVCSNNCVTLTSDVNNCGACGVKCGSDQICSNSVCVASPASCSNQGLEWAYVDNTSGGDYDETYSVFYPETYKSRLPEETGVTTSIGGLDSRVTPLIYGSNDLYGSNTYFVLNHRGYLFAPETGTYTLTAPMPDDLVNVWLGPTAYSGWNRANANLDNTYGRHGDRTATFDLVAGTYYPFRVVFAQAQGPSIFSLSLTTPSGKVLLDSTTQGSQYVIRSGCGAAAALAPAYPPFGSET